MKFGYKAKYNDDNSIIIITMPIFNSKISEGILMGKKKLSRIFYDMLDCLKIDANGKIFDMPYFLGTMLFIGNLEMAGQTLDVVDGQQRLTIITILFSAISDHFREIGNDKLSERIFQYIMTEDDNGDLVRILQSKTHYPFFSYYIQDIKKEIKEEANSEEEICIQETFDYLYQRTSENSLRSSLCKLHGKSYVDNITYGDILKALRDQVLKKARFHAQCDCQTKTNIYQYISTGCTKIVLLNEYGRLSDIVRTSKDEENCKKLCMEYNIV